MVFQVFSNTKVEYAKSMNIVELFETQVLKTPEHTAVICGDKSISYDELNSRANCIAEFLRICNVGVNDCVAVIEKRGIRLIASLLGIVKAGGAYVPIDDSYPVKRIEYIIKDCSPKVIITDLPEESSYGVSLKAIREIINKNGLDIPIALVNNIVFEKDKKNLKKVNQPEDLFYVIYTSGTTGNPKGVMITHKNINAYVCAFKHEFKTNEETVFLQQATYAFDIFTEEVYPTLLSGGTVCVVPEEIKLNFEQLNDYIEKNQVTMISCSPLMLNEFGKKHPSVKVYISGGDVLKKEYFERLQGAEIYNTYGPTETTVCATYYNCTRNRDKMIYIGKPIANTQVYIIHAGKLCNIGEEGELCIAGDGVAKGYLNNEELTKEKFIDNHFGEGRLYKTGDLAKWCEDGNIEFVGRKDEQVKIRGFRIELKEIESVIKEYRKISDCGVIVNNDSCNEKAIYAYIVADESIDIEKLRDYLETKLPMYMFPSQIIQIEKMPMNINGKLDKKKLLSYTEILQKDYIPPKDAVERSVCKMFSELLNIDKVSTDDNFFYLGGHSLRALRLINKIQEQYNIRLNIKTIFEKKTVQRLAEEIKSISARDEDRISPINRQAYYPMSSAQKRLYMISEIDDAKVTYNITEYLQIAGKVDKDKLEEALQQLINRHEILRTSLNAEGDQFYQVVLPEVKVELEYKYIQETEKDTKLKEFIRPFELCTPPLIRMKLLETDQKNYLVYDIHHTVSDGMSIGIMLEELIKLYNGESLEPLEVQYKDYCAWTVRRNTDTQRKYWLNQFEDEVPVLEMPTDYKRSLKQSFKGAHVKGMLNQSAVKRILELAKETGTTEYMILVSALMIMLMKYSRQEDTVIGTPVSSRTNKDTETMLGMFVNTLMLRGRPQKDKVYLDFLNEIKGTCLEAYDNQEYTFEELVEELHITRDTARRNLFDIMFVLQNNEAPQSKMKGAVIEKYEAVNNSTSKFDITINIEYKTDGYEIDFEYCTELYREETISRMFKHYCKILDEILDHPYRQLADLDMVTEDEASMIYDTFNPSGEAYPQEKTVMALFEKQAKMTPNKIAVMCGDEKITYAELNKKANCIAHRLREMGVGRDDRVAVLAEKSIVMIAGVIGIVKAGGAYVPIAPDYPKERIGYIAEDCGAKAILLHQVKADLPGRKIIDLADANIYTEAAENLDNINLENDLIYVIYTSGTTGNPKGVMIEHKSVIRLVINPNYAALNEETVILQTGQMSFDASTFEVWGALLNGGSLVLAKDDVLLDVNKLEKMIKDEKVNTLWLTSTLFNQMFMSSCHMFDTVKYLLIGGEKLSQMHVSEFKKRNKYTTLINGYGPTESTTFTTTYVIPEHAEEIPIGKPINHTKVYVMDGSKLCGIGVLGELCIAGDGLARGYLNNEDLTKEKFIKSPFSDERLYKSGDLVKWGADGNIYYVGRIDEQVKIRGFRIELGEIDTVLRKIEGIKDCAVIVRVNEMQDKAIYAYFVSERERNIKEIRSELAKELPEYMIPAYMMQIDSIPVTKNGKMDRKAFPDIAARYSQEYEAPKNEVEEIICKVFAEILNAEKVSVSSSFYELGGDSIKAIRVVSKLREHGYTTNARDILNFKTARNLAVSMGREEGVLADQGEISGGFEPTPIIHFFNQLKLNKPEHFNQSMMIKLYHADEDKIKNVFEKIIEHHDALRAVKREDGMYIRKINEGKLFDYYEYEMDDKNAAEYIYETGTDIQASFDLEKGPLVKLVLFKEKEAQHLLIIIHHLAVDGVSWRIILEDFSKGYRQSINGEAVKLPLKTASYREWAQKLKEYATGSRLLEEKKYWIKVDEMVDRGRVKRTLNEPAKYNAIDFYLEQAVTQKILTETKERYDAAINDILLAALGMAFKAVTGQKYVTVEMEGHGREMVMEDTSVDRTVGWFTIIYPIVLSPEDSIAKSVAHAKEMFRNIPSNGFGYNILKYLTDMKFNTEIDVSFNYLGEFEEGAAEGIAFSEYACGEEISKENQFGRPIGFDGLIKNGRLCFTVSYDEGKYDKAFIEDIIQKYAGELENIANNQEEADCIKVASDYGFNELSIDEFDDMMSAINDLLGE